MRSSKTYHFINSKCISRGGAQKILHLLLDDCCKVTSLLDYKFKNKLLVLMYQFFIFFLRIEKPRFVIVHSRCYMILLPVFKFYSIKSVLYVHAQYRSGNFLYKLFKADAYITVSAAVKKHLISNGVLGSEISVIYNPYTAGSVVDNKFESDSDTFFCSVGSIKPWKGFFEASKYLADFCRMNNKKYTYKIIGEGYQKLNLERFSASQNYINIECNGFSTNPYKELAKYPFILIPSLEEGFGLVAIESMYQNKIIIYSGVPALSEICSLDPLSFEFDINNPSSFHAAVKLALKAYSENELCKYETSRRSYVVDNFSLDSFNLIYKSFLKDNFN